MCWLKSRFKSLWQKIMLNIISMAIIRACSGSCHSTWLVPVTHSGLALPGLGRLLTAEWLRLEDSWRWSRPTSAQSKGSKSRLFRTVASWVLSSSKYGDFTTSVGNLFHSLTTFMVKLDNKIKYFHLFKWNFLPICAHSLLPPMRRV